MPLGTNHTTNATQGTFIPELWSDEIIATYKSNLVMPNLVTIMNHVGKKGDTIHIPVPTRGEANRKVAEQQVTLNSAITGEKVFNINEHFEYSRFFEDFTEKQQLDSFRKFVTDDAGYALSRVVDTALFRRAEELQGGTLGGNWANAVTGADGETAYDGTNAGALTDIAIRCMIQKLDDADVPQMGRALVVPPSERKNLLGIDRYTIFDQVGEAGGANSIRNGAIGMIYGMPVYVTNNTLRLTAGVEDAAGDDAVALLLQKDALVLIEQMKVRTQTDYIQQYLSTLFTSDMIFDTGTLREEGGVAAIVNK